MSYLDSLSSHPQNQDVKFFYDSFLFPITVDETRVALKPIHGAPGSDYINASFVDVSVFF